MSVMRKRVLALVLLCPTLVHAEDEAVRLASVLAAEKPCGLVFDAPAIENWIETNVAADDLDRHFLGNGPGDDVAHALGGVGAPDGVGLGGGGVGQ